MAALYFVAGGYFPLLLGVSLGQCIYLYFLIYYIVVKLLTEIIVGVGLGNKMLVTLYAI